MNIRLLINDILVCANVVERGILDKSISIQPDIEDHLDTAPAYIRTYLLQQRAYLHAQSSSDTHPEATPSSAEAVSSTLDTISNPTQGATSPMVTKSTTGSCKNPASFTYTTVTDVSLITKYPTYPNILAHFTASMRHETSQSLYALYTTLVLCNYLWDKGSFMRCHK